MKKKLPLFHGEYPIDVSRFVRNNNKKVQTNKTPFHTGLQTKRP